jgi:hypothetical protein
MFCTFLVNLVTIFRRSKWEDGCERFEVFGRKRSWTILGNITCVLTRQTEENHEN